MKITSAYELRLNKEFPKLWLYVLIGKYAVIYYYQNNSIFVIYISGRMSAEQVEILEGIKEKIQSVKDRMQQQLDENDRLKQQNEDLQQVVQQKQSLIDELEQKNQQLSLVKSIMADSEDAHDARIRINRIVREIDKCIALLNR